MYDYRATCLRLVGPLSLHLDIDMGFNTHYFATVRLDSLKQPEGGQQRKQVMNLVAQWFNTHADEDGRVTVRSLHAREKFGRWLVVVSGADGAVLNSELLSSGLVEHIEDEDMPAEKEQVEAGA